jgi:hypothetical protein
MIAPVIVLPVIPRFPIAIFQGATAFCVLKKSALCRA